MNKNNNKFRINQNSARVQPLHKTEVSLLSSFFSRASQKIREKASAAYSKLENKLIQTPAVFTVPQREDREIQVSHFSKDRGSSISKNPDHLKGRAISSLNELDGERIKILLLRRQELMQKLRRVDSELKSPPHTSVIMEMNESRASGGSPFKQMESRIKMQQKQTYNSIQHEKTIEMLSRINNEKMRRQEKIVHEMKKKQEKEIQKLVEIENNKSHLQLHRQSRANPLLKFNTKEIENLQFDFKPTPAIESNRRLSEKVENEFDELPELVTKEKECIEFDEKRSLSQESI